MKSTQFNYFAADGDLALIADIVLGWHPHIVIFPPRGSGEEIHGTPAHDEFSLIPKTCGEMMFLSPSEYSGNVRTTLVDDSISCIQIQSNPVVEYSPSAPVSEDVIKIGRFYASYGDPEFMARVKSLFKSLKKHAIKLNDSGLWIFPVAARTKRKLRPWGGQDWDNPLLLNND